jgi:hypothetical protein
MARISHRGFLHPRSLNTFPLSGAGTPGPGASRRSLSYQTNVKALRYGLGADWHYKGAGPVGASLLSERLRSYLGNTVTFVVPPAPQRAKTKGQNTGKPMTMPGLQGRSLVLDDGQRVVAYLGFFLNTTLLDSAQAQSLRENFSRVIRSAEAGLGRPVRLRLANYFDFFFLGQLQRQRLPRAASAALVRHLAKPERRRALATARLKGELIYRMRRGLRRYRRQQYCKRSLRPMMAALFFAAADLELLARALAFELQILRVRHRRFLQYARAFLQRWMSPWSEGLRPQEGLSLTVKGRLTPFRRQSRRTATHVYRYGVVKRSHLGSEADSAQAYAYNRFGVISVRVDAQLRRRSAEPWEYRGGDGPLRLFTLRELLETTATLGGRGLIPAAHSLNTSASGGENTPLGTLRRGWQRRRWARALRADLQSPRGSSRRWLLRPRLERRLRAADGHALDPHPRRSALGEAFRRRMLSPTPSGPGPNSTPAQTPCHG